MRRIVISLRMFWLLAALLFLLVLTPIVEELGSQNQRLYLVVISTFLLIALVHAANARPAGRFLGIGIAVIWLLLSWSNLFSEALQIALAADAALLVLLFYTLVLLIARMITVEETDFDSLCAAVAAYLLIAVAWAVSYQVIERIAPGSFAFPGAAPALLGSHFFYYSLTTVTTLGYGDITPLSPIARVWSALEAATGALYIALFIARLIGLYRR